ncbi:MAG: cyclic nucleotide-binding domain-containing protein [bacterium]
MKIHEPLLNDHPFFQKVNPRFLDLLTGCASHVRFNAGDYVFKEGEEAKQFYLIRQGKVSMEMYCPPKGIVLIQTMTEGDVLGWSWLMPPYTWRFSARATELTRAFALDGECLRNKFAQDHDLGYEMFSLFIPVIVECLEATRVQLLDVYK